MTLTERFLKSCSDEELKRLTKMTNGKKVAINSIELFQKFENLYTSDMRFLDILKSFEEISNNSAIKNFGIKPHPGSINNCMGRWFELLFFKFFNEFLSAYSTKDKLKEICKLPSAKDSKKFMDLFVERQKTLLKKINPSTSNPDFIILDNLTKSVYPVGLTWIEKFQNTSFFGNIDMQNIAAIISIKTSARPDRRYQQLYEANLVKAIALRFRKKVKFLSITLHENIKNEEVYYSPSIISIVQGGTLEPSIDKSATLDKISDIKQIIEIIFE